MRKAPYTGFSVPTAQENNNYKTALLGLIKPTVGEVKVFGERMTFNSSISVGESGIYLPI